jgi:hypothetical protein
MSVVPYFVVGLIICKQFEGLVKRLNFCAVFEYRNERLLGEAAVDGAVWAVLILAQGDGGSGGKVPVGKAGD